MLSDADKQEIKAAPDNERPGRIVEKVRPQLRPIWSFFVALCFELQRGEHKLDATDAFWLGLIDEVVGVNDLPSLRVFVQHAYEEAQKARANPAEVKADSAAADS